MRTGCGAQDSKQSQTNDERDNHKHVEKYRNVGQCQKWDNMTWDNMTSTWYVSCATRSVREQLDDHQWRIQRHVITDRIYKCMVYTFLLSSLVNYINTLVLLVDRSTTNWTIGTVAIQDLLSDRRNILESSDAWTVCTNNGWLLQLVANSIVWVTLKERHLKLHESISRSRRNVGDRD